MPVYNYTTLDDPLAKPGATQASGINGTELVGQYTDASGRIHGFLLSGGVYTTIDD